MIKTKYSRRTFYTAPQDDLAVQEIQEKYGLSTASDAVRFAVRLVAASPVATVGKKKTK